MMAKVRMTIPAGTTPGALEAFYSQGLLRKTALCDGAYYLGHCRNAEFARWSSPLDRFVHVRHKFDDRFFEEICHPADEAQFDVFQATKEVQVARVPEPARLDDTAFARYVSDALKHIAQTRR